MNHVRVSVERSEKGLLYAFVFFLKKIENFLLKKMAGRDLGPDSFLVKNYQFFLQNEVLNLLCFRATLEIQKK